MTTPRIKDSDMPVTWILLVQVMLLKVPVRFVIALQHRCGRITRVFCMNEIYQILISSWGSMKMSSMWTTRMRMAMC
ncbi:hypothetical protein AZE42_14184, partial [Rhizopogon vesiculosus]